MPKAPGALLSLRAKGVIGGHRRGLRRSTTLTRPGGIFNNRMARTLIPDLALVPLHTCGTSWNWGAPWVQLIAATAENLVLFGAHHRSSRIYTATPAPVVGYIETQLAVGAAGFEIPFASIGLVATLWVVVGNPNPVLGHVQQDNAYGPVGIPAGSRLAFRSRTNHFQSFDVGVVPYGYPAASFPAIERILDTLTFYQGGYTGADGSLTVPTNTYASLQAGAPAWTWGAWVEVLPSAAHDILLSEIDFAQGGFSNGAQIQIGVGAAGSEVPIEQVTAVSIHPLSMFPSGTASIYFAPVSAGERVALRAASNAANLILRARLRYESMP